jgi:hypothetical protein
MHSKDIVKIALHKLQNNLRNYLLISGIFVLGLLPSLSATLISNNASSIDVSLQKSVVKENVLVLSELKGTSVTKVEKLLDEKPEQLEELGIVNTTKGLELNVPQWIWFDSIPPTDQTTPQELGINQITLLPKSLYQENSIVEEESKLENGKTEIPLLYNSYLANLKINSKNFAEIKQEMEQSIGQSLPLYSQLSPGKTELNESFNTRFIGFGGGEGKIYGVLTPDLESKLENYNNLDSTLVANPINLLEFDSKASKLNFINKYELQDKNSYNDKVSRLISIVKVISNIFFLLALIILLLVSTRDLLSAKRDLAMFGAMGMKRQDMVSIFFFIYTFIGIVAITLSLTLAFSLLAFLGHFSNFYADLFLGSIASPNLFNAINIFSLNYQQLALNILLSFTFLIIPFSLISIFINRINIISTLK